MEIITSFLGAYGCFSNFFKREITVNEITYGSSEAAYQSFKSFDEDIRKSFSNLEPADAKKAGRSLPIRYDWDAVKQAVMKDILRIKFSAPDLKNVLLGTSDALIVEGNRWHDNKWGNCHCGREACDFVGENMLGEILMELRDDFLEEIFQGASV